MKTYVYIRFKPHPRYNAIGNVVEIVPMKKEYIGTKDMDAYFIVVMDLNIPCGQGEVTEPYIMDFNERDFSCVKCPFQNTIDCELIKYKVRIWTAGDVFKPPRPTVSKWKIDISKFLNVSELSQVKKAGKTSVEKNAMFVLAASKEQAKTIFEDQSNDMG